MRRLRRGVRDGASSVKERMTGARTAAATVSVVYSSLTEVAHLIVGRFSGTEGSYLEVRYD